jgi:hypothetical protein
MWKSAWTRKTKSLARPQSGVMPCLLPLKPACQDTRKLFRLSCGIQQDVCRVRPVLFMGRVALRRHAPIDTEKDEGFGIGSKYACRT